MDLKTFNFMKISINRYNRYTGSPLGAFQNLFTNIYNWGHIVEGLRKSAGVAHMLRRNLAQFGRPQHRDHDPTLCDKCVGSFKSLNREIERLGLRFNVLIRENKIK